MHLLFGNVRGNPCVLSSNSLINVSDMSADKDIKGTLMAYKTSKGEEGVGISYLLVQLSKVIVLYAEGLN